METAPEIFSDNDLISNKKSQTSKVIVVKGVPLWRKFFRLPIRSSVKFLWNLVMMFQFVLPLNITSRIWGWMNGLQLPIMTRVPIYKLYSFLYRCNLDEMLDPDLRKYNNLSEFFRRSLKLECRPIDTQSLLVSPVDGRILSLGPVYAGHLHNVKGINYTLKGFLGPANWSEGSTSSGHFTNLLEKERRDMKESDRNRSDCSDTENESFIDAIKRDKSTRLFHCIIYLAPGDYHKFHSPTDWNVTFRRHFPGKLFSVNPLFTSWIKNLFCLNERAVYVGSWLYGFFSFTAVGANNVGSITVHCDPLLKTNKPTSRLLRGVIRGWHIISRTAGYSGPKLQQRYYDSKLAQKPLQKSPSLTDINRGDLFGEFNFGSTVVLIFEAPASFKFGVEINDAVKVGQALALPLSCD